MFGGDPNDPNGDVQKAIGCGCFVVVAIVVAVIVALVKAL